VKRTHWTLLRFGDSAGDQWLVVGPQAASVAAVAARRRNRTRRLRAPVRTKMRRVLMVAAS